VQRWPNLINAAPGGADLTSSTELYLVALDSSGFERVVPPAIRSGS
jgi:hypothetical protein